MNAGAYALYDKETKNKKFQFGSYAEKQSRRDAGAVIWKIRIGWKCWISVRNFRV